MCIRDSHGTGHEPINVPVVPASGPVERVRLRLGQREHREKQNGYGKQSVSHRVLCLLLVCGAVRNIRVCFLFSSCSSPATRLARARHRGVLIYIYIYIYIYRHIHTHTSTHTHYMHTPWHATSKDRPYRCIHPFAVAAGGNKSTCKRVHFCEASCLLGLPGSALPLSLIHI